jgi:hypothetical protein
VGNGCLRDWVDVSIVDVLPEIVHKFTYVFKWRGYQRGVERRSAANPTLFGSKLADDLGGDAWRVTSGFDASCGASND